MTTPRNHSFGQNRSLTVMDRLGRWLSNRRIAREVGRSNGREAADIGCGFDAKISTMTLDGWTSVLLFDLALDPALDSRPGWQRIEGPLPDTLSAAPDASLDVVICNNVLEHLIEDRKAVEEIHRILRPGGMALINVPSWTGKFVLETAAFRLNLAPADEMDDHKRYYSTNELWTLLVAGGFLPSNLKVSRAKLGTNTFARAIR